MWSTSPGHCIESRGVRNMGVESTEEGNEISGKCRWGLSDMNW